MSTRENYHRRPDLRTITNGISPATDDSFKLIETDGIPPNLDQLIATAKARVEKHPTDGTAKEKLAKLMQLKDQRDNKRETVLPD